MTLRIKGTLIDFRCPCGTEIHHHFRLRKHLEKDRNRNLNFRFAS